jgi:hypothetical protein
MDANHKVLVPTDFSAHADEAYRVARPLELRANSVR